MKRVRLPLAGLSCACLCSCDWPDHNGVHMAYCLKQGVHELAQPTSPELVIRFEPLDGTNQIYAVELVPDGLVLVAGKHAGISTYDLNYVQVDKRFDLMKTNAATFLTLRKAGDGIDVVDVR